MTLHVADLFAGAGGCSTGLMQAAQDRGQRVSLVAVNHWPTAVETHTVNHPEARHFCASVETLDLRVAVPGGKLDLLIAAPECVHFSMARGGRPMSDQSRASAWDLLRWLELLRVEDVLIENVTEFQTWGPLGANGRPLKSRRGETFQAFIAAVESYGYRVEWKVLNAADYGAATTRRRLFIRAKLGRKPIVWPAPTHSRNGSPTLFGGTRRWRAAREVIDWSLPIQSIYSRKKPLTPKTMRRLEIGLVRCGGQPFLLGQQSGAVARSVDLPAPTVATDGAIALVVPFTMPYCSNGGHLARPVTEPLSTITTKDRIALVIPRGSDVLYRLLQPHELAAAMSFPRTYAFTGNKGDRVKQIGNAVDVSMARALCGAILDAKRPRAEKDEAVA